MRGNSEVSRPPLDDAFSESFKSVERQVRSLEECAFPAKLGTPFSEYILLPICDEECRIGTNFRMAGQNSMLFAVITLNFARRLAATTARQRVGSGTATAELRAGRALTNAEARP
jgi:hypothetical protein